jgi:hypothetical protein
MRWARGLLRLWIVASLFWVLIAAHLTGVSSMVALQFHSEKGSLECPNKADGIIDFECLERLPGASRRPDASPRDTLLAPL